MKTELETCIASMRVEDSLILILKLRNTFASESSFWIKHTMGFQLTMNLRAILQKFSPSTPASMVSVDFTQNLEGIFVMRFLPKLVFVHKLMCWNS